MSGSQSFDGQSADASSGNSPGSPSAYHPISQCCDSSSKNTPENNFRGPCLHDWPDPLNQERTSMAPSDYEKHCK